MSETQTFTTEKSQIDPALKTGELQLESGRTKVYTGDVAVEYQKPWNYEELGGEEAAAELHEANVDWATSLGGQVDTLLGDQSSIETPLFTASRVEIPRPASSDGQPGYRYDLQMTEAHQSRTALTLTVMDGRPELTFHSEPLDTEKYPLSTDSYRYRSGSWDPEDIGVDRDEEQWNGLFAKAGEGLKQAGDEVEKTERHKNRSFGRKVLDRLAPMSSK